MSSVADPECLGASHYPESAHSLIPLPPASTPCPRDHFQSDSALLHSPDEVYIHVCFSGSIFTSSCSLPHTMKNLTHKICYCPDPGNWDCRGFDFPKICKLFSQICMGRQMSQTLFHGHNAFCASNAYINSETMKHRNAFFLQEKHKQISIVSTKYWSKHILFCTESKFISWKRGWMHLGSWKLSSFKYYAPKYSLWHGGVWFGQEEELLYGKPFEHLFHNLDIQFPFPH